MRLALNYFDMSIPWLLPLIWISNLIFLSQATFLANPTAEPFVCAGKVIGGYYADVQTNCQMFHVCTIGENGEIRDIVFRCLQGTVFDQETRVCEREEESNCSTSVSFYHLNNDLYGPGIIPEEIIYQTRFSIPGATLSDEDEANVKFSCDGKTDGDIYGDIQTGCTLLHRCLSSADGRMSRTSYKCKEGLSFDFVAGICSDNADPVSCSEENSVYSGVNIDLKKDEIKIDVTDQCSSLPSGTLLADLKSGCRSFEECVAGNDPNVPMVYHRTCKDGYLFSQKHYQCWMMDDVDCMKEALPVLISLSKFKNFVDFSSNQYLDDTETKNLNSLNLDNPLKKSKSLKDIFRNSKMRASFLNGKLESKSGKYGDHFRSKRALRAASQPAVFFTDHASVVASHSDGNTLEGKISPDASGSSDTLKRIEIFKHDQFNHKQSHDTHREISEIKSTNSRGAVVISSIVPKTVRQNGNGGRNIITTSTKAPVDLSINETDLEPVESTPSTMKTAIEEIEETTMQSITEMEVTVEQIMQTTTPAPVVTEFTESTLAEIDIVSTEPPTTTTTAPASQEPSTTPTTTTTTPVTTTSAVVTVTQKVGSTNFTCKDKELEQFYPDLESNCRLFHYCSPGIVPDEIFDLTFLCTGDTLFDIRSKKCQDESTVTCGSPAQSTSPMTPTPSPSTAASPSPTPESTTTPTPSATPMPVEAKDVTDSISSTINSTASSMKSADTEKAFGGTDGAHGTVAISSVVPKTVGQNDDGGRNIITTSTKAPVDLSINEPTDSSEMSSKLTTRENWDIINGATPINHEHKHGHHDKPTTEQPNETVPVEISETPIILLKTTDPVSKNTVSQDSEISTVIDISEEVHVFEETTEMEAEVTVTEIAMSENIDSGNTTSFNRSESPLTTIDDEFRSTLFMDDNANTTVIGDVDLMNDGVSFDLSPITLDQDQDKQNETVEDRDLEASSVQLEIDLSTPESTLAVQEVTEELIVTGSQSQSPSTSVEPPTPSTPTELDMDSTITAIEFNEEEITEQEINGTMNSSMVLETEEMLDSFNLTILNDSTLLEISPFITENITNTTDDADYNITTTEDFSTDILTDTYLTKSEIAIPPTDSIATIVEAPELAVKPEEPSMEEDSKILEPSDAGSLSIVTSQ